MSSHTIRFGQQPTHYLQEPPKHPLQESPKHSLQESIPKDKTSTEPSNALRINSFHLIAAFYQTYFTVKCSRHMTERFELSEKLGKGGNGTVHKVQGDIGAKRTRALKIVLESKDLESSEIKGLISLNQFDQHFTRFYGWWTEGPDLYLLTEFMKGGDLQTHIGEGPKFISESKAQIIAKKIIESTVIMHSMGIIHQDLKPGNILLANKEGDPLDIRIGDMGISKNIGGRGNARSAGTRGYMAPEVIAQRNGKTMPTPSSATDMLNYAPDLWSVGCLIFATLTGTSPYPDDIIPDNDKKFPTEILQYHEVSELGIKFIQSLVKVDRAKRMTAKMALEHRWLLLVDSPPGES